MSGTNTSWKVKTVKVSPNSIRGFYDEDIGIEMVEVTYDALMSEDLTIDENQDHETVYALPRIDLETHAENAESKYDAIMGVETFVDEWFNGFRPKTKQDITGMLADCVVRMYINDDMSESEAIKTVGQKRILWRTKPDEYEYNVEL